MCRRRRRRTEEKDYIICKYASILKSLLPGNFPLQEVERKGEKEESGKEREIVGERK